MSRFHPQSLYTAIFTCLIVLSTRRNDGAVSSFSWSSTSPSLRQMSGTHAFIPPRYRKGSSKLCMVSVDLDEIKAMRAGEIKKELESMGVSTKSFFEKTELVEALREARASGKVPVKESVVETASSEENGVDDGIPREEKIAKEMEVCKAMKAGELKAELESLGISTKSFFEKSEFVKALAEARVDGVKQKADESYAEYADVEVLPADGPGPKTNKAGADGSKQQQSSPFGGGGSPFGGGAGGMPNIADMFGGMGGGAGGVNIADMMKNMGGGGGGGMPNMADMFGGMGGGAGGMPNIGKVQEMMANPKVRELMEKAQKNPRIMQAMTECMSNPSAFAKYQSDPEIAELVNELRKYM